MKPSIGGTRFGSITVDGETFEYDILIRLDGRVKKRKKKLSKAVFGTSHVISLDEARHVYQRGAGSLIIGTGQEGCVELSKEAAAYLEKKGCAVRLGRTPEAAGLWNEAEGETIGLFHVTC